MVFKKKKDVEKEIEEIKEKIEEEEKELEEMDEEESEDDEEEEEEKPAKKKLKKEKKLTFQVASIPTQTVPVIIDTKTNEQYDTIAGIAKILNILEGFE